MKRCNYAAANLTKGTAELVSNSSSENLFLNRCFSVLLGIVIAFSPFMPKICAQGIASNHSTHSDVDSLISVQRADFMRKIDYWLNLGIGNAPQNDTYMTDYAATLDSLDITVNVPDSFSLVPAEEMKRPSLFSPNPDFVTKYFHCVDGWSVTGPVLESAAKDALFVYPILIDCESPIRKMESELIVAHQNDDLDITPLITHIAGKDAQVMSNADEVFFYDYDMSKPILGKYNHVVGIVLIKKGHYPLGLKIIMDDDGLKKKEEYVKLLLNNVTYGDKPLEECLEKERNNLLNSTPVKFPLKKYQCHGLT